jgi:hypothetical protein
VFIAYARTWYNVKLLRPVIETENDPVVPDVEALLPDVVGFTDVLQQTPRSVIVLPPSETTVPLPVAVIGPIFVTAPDVTVGVVGAATILAPIRPKSSVLNV